MGAATYPPFPQSLTDLIYLFCALNFELLGLKSFDCPSNKLTST